MSGGQTPPPVARSILGLITQAAQTKKVPLIPALAAGFGVLILLFLCIALMRGGDEPTTGTEPSSTSRANAGSLEETSKEAAPKSTTTSKTKGKRNWDKVKW